MLIDKAICEAHALVIDANPVSRSVIVSQLRDLGVEHVRQSGRVSDARLWLEERKRSANPPLRRRRRRAEAWPPIWTLLRRRWVRWWLACAMHSAGVTPCLASA